MLEFIHNTILGALSIYGAVLLGRWVLARGWHWVAKFVVLVFVASLIVSGASLMLGEADDLRIFTEILASAGAIIAATSLLGRRGARRNPWVQYGVPVAVLLFLAFTWREQIQDIRHGGISMSPPMVMTPAPNTTPPATATVPAPRSYAESKARLCKEGKLSKQTCDD